MYRRLQNSDGEKLHSGAAIFRPRVNEGPFPVPSGTNLPVRE
ncbi:hypothetical protein FTUN_6438 [Frigoriglobus tundricola]|uniref:Uncharacterized protein n=1 Tax=Frigoriglobus tundricola TaxID=2774151 RepID=A0A6M5Z039_9BACT|nr:hypothetical protein FTUN_6438 [Frigoriglobus tundricola]